ncbi:NTP transferase domain-containing protein [Actinomadura madurae]|uniref:MobA-like NTP transferase domain-containing protein n=1 Tax=Actinomadura madurae TaxID=1993 RepID=A0A1I5F539_9ACTN|nr:NTP transferase domain-containing protein [Actinomadura madurae]SFO18739.1 MobA-like NTP transferase domain-containing protein [Actinomadura madurae]SPT60218.1 Bifunctional protein GlmU [Actinomadura madurae]
MNRSVCAVIPAAGRGTRLGLDVPKIMAEIADGVTVWHLLHRALRASVDHVHVVIAPAAETRFHRLAAEEIAGGAVSVSVQREPTGMGDAVFGASGHWESHGGILVVWGDQVNLSGRTVRRVVDAHLRAPGLTIPLVPMPDPYVEYELSGGRLLRVRQSREGDACRPGGLGDVGVFCLATGGLAAAWRDYLAAAPRGAMTGEVNFLPFLTYLSLIRGRDVTAVQVDDPDEARGINTAADLEFARRRHAERAG